MIFVTYSWRLDADCWWGWWYSWGWWRGRTRRAYSAYNKFKYIEKVTML